VNYSLIFLAQMSYDEQSDKLAGTIGLLKQLVPFRGPPLARVNLLTDTSHAQEGKSLKTLHRFLVEGPSRRQEWAN